MTQMFRGLRSLTELDVSKFDTSSLKVANFMFVGDYKLKKLDVSNWNTSKLESA